MKARTQYTDLFGTAAADIADITTQSNDLTQLANFFKINQERFEVIGISVYGTEDFYVSFICVDKEKSTPEKDHIVKLYIDEEYKDILSLLFKRLEIVLYGKFDNKYPSIDDYEEVRLSDFKGNEDK